MMKKVIVLLMFFYAGVFAQNRGDIDYIELLDEVEVEEMEAFYEANYGYGFVAGIVPPQNAVSFYKIKYHTLDVGDTPTTATGLIAVPNVEGCSLPVAIYNHGTFYDYASMPSNLGFESLIGVVLSSEGFITALPDLIGYGDESPGTPNYIHAKTAGTANVDMMRAIKNWSEQQDSIVFDLSGQLFITGYSQGGHSAMAAHREFQQFHSDEFTVTASACGSGPYDVSGTQTDFMFESENYPQVAYIGIIILSYTEIYSDIITEQLFYDNIIDPYDEIMVDVLAQFNLPLGQVNSMFPSNPYELFDADYLNDFLTNPEHPLRVIFEDNDVYEWVPQSPLRMGFCTGDHEVSPNNARVAYEYMTENGATDVDTVNLGGQAHFDCALPFLLNARSMFNEMKQPCEPTSIAFKPNAKAAIEIVHATGSDIVLIRNHNKVAEDLSVRLFDNQGKLIQNLSIDGYARMVKLNAPLTGIYHLVITNNNDLFTTKKLMINR